MAGAVTTGHRAAGAAGATVGARAVRLFDCDVHALTMADTLAEVDRLVARGTPSQHCVVNAAKAVAMADDERLREIVASCDLVNADGQAVVWASRLLGVPLPERVAGIDLFEALLARAARKGWAVYFLGARQHVVDAVVERARREHPALRIAGRHHGYLHAQHDTDEVVAQVRAAAPDILFVGMPSPKKEYWLAENLERLGVPFCMGVGGSFDVYAGKTRRAPKWMQDAGLEWLYRFAQEPRRMWKRYIIGNARFVCLVARERRRRGMSFGRRRPDRPTGDG